MVSADGHPGDGTVLYLSYTGLMEPLGRRQVLPYLVGLARLGWRLRVISFEKARTADAAAIRQVSQTAQQAGLEWLPLRYHGWPTLPAKAFDMVHGVVRGALGWRETRIVHARSTVAAGMAASLARLFGVPWVFDVRGLLAEEYVDGGHWSKDGLAYRVTDRAEQRLLRKADGLVFLTEKMRNTLLRAGSFPAGTPVATVPCSVDLATFRPDPEARAAVRGALGVGEAPLLVYSGSLGSWYRLPEMLDFFGEARRTLPRLQLLVLTPQKTLAERAAREKGLGSEVIVLSLRPEEVPHHLAAADAGICFLSNVFSKGASSPTKYAEYLACGLPVVSDSWTGDAGRLSGEKAWILVHAFSPAEYGRATRELDALLATATQARREARALAEREFGLEVAVARYDALYRTLLGSRR